MRARPSVKNKKTVRGARAAAAAQAEAAEIAEAVEVAEPSEAAGAAIAAAEFTEADEVEGNVEAPKPEEPSAHLDNDSAPTVAIKAQEDEETVALKSSSGSEGTDNATQKAEAAEVAEAAEAAGVAGAESKEKPAPFKPYNSEAEAKKQAALDEVETKRKKRKRRRIIKRLVIGFFIFIVLAAISACVFFLVWRYTLANDAQDIQGKWRISDGTNQYTATITKDSIHLNEDVAYEYVLDPGAKTISFTFGNLKGQARYRFSLDRNQLAISDSTTNWFESLSDDAQWTLNAIANDIMGNQLSPSLEGADTLQLERA